MKVSFSSNFKKAYKKRIRFDVEKQLKFIECLALFMNAPYHPKLRTHKLIGELKELWSFSIEYDLRVVFYFISDTEVIFEDIGTHDDVY